jgi:hypothetical protein
VCTVTIYYSWSLASPTTDQIVMSYAVATNPSAINLTINPTTANYCNGSTWVCRTSQVQSFTSISVPANGTITTEDVSVTL